MILHCHHKVVDNSNFFHPRVNFTDEFLNLFMFQKEFTSYYK